MSGDGNHHIWLVCLLTSNSWHIKRTEN